MKKFVVERIDAVRSIYIVDAFDEEDACDQVERDEVEFIINEHTTSDIRALSASLGQFLSPYEIIEKTLGDEYD